MDEIRVMLIDNNDIFREGIKRILEYEVSIHVIATGNEASDLGKMLQMLKPEILILDAEIIWNKQLHILEDIASRHPHTKPIVFSLGHLEDFVPEHLEMGVKGYMLKTMSRAGFIDAVKTVHAGNFYVHPVFSDELVKHYLRLQRGMGG